MSLRKMLNLHLLPAAVCLVSALSASSQVFAAEGTHPHHLAVVLGGSFKNPTTSNTDGKAAATYGVEYSYQSNSRFELGAWVSPPPPGSKAASRSSSWARPSGSDFSGAVR